MSLNNPELKYGNGYESRVMTPAEHREHFLKIRDPKLWEELELKRQKEKLKMGAGALPPTPA